MPTVLSTDQIKKNERPSYWNYLVSSVFGRLNTIPDQFGPFSGKIAYSQMSSATIAEVASSQLKVIRPEKYIQDPEEDFYKINFQLKGDASVSQSGRTAELKPGMWTIYDNTRPYELQMHSDYRQLLFVVPRSQLLNRLPTIDLFLAQPMHSNTGMGRLLFQFIEGALQESEQINTESQTHTVQMMFDLLMLGLANSNPHQDQSAVPLSASHRMVQLRQFIASHLHNPDLSADMLASNLFLSKRYIQQLFANENTTVNQTIWQMRLERCQKDLEDPRLANRPIQDIALAWGFRNGAHFSRLFKQFTGSTPSAYRSQALHAYR